MARTFTRASSHFLQYSTAVVTAYPLTMACWFYSGDATVNQGLMSIADTAGNNNYFYLQANGVAAGDPVSAVARDSGTPQSADTSTGFSTNTWTHAAGVFTSTISRTAYINAGSAVTNITSTSPAGLDVTAIGRLSRSAPTDYMSGRIAVPCVWNVALSAAEVAELATGIVPWMVRPESIVACWPLHGYSSPELDMFGAAVMTVTGATAIDNPRLLFKRGRHVFAPFTAAAVVPPPLPTIANFSPTRAAFY